MPSPYQVAPLFLIRMAGVPFDLVEKLATSRTSAAARQLLDAREKLAEARAAAEQFLRPGPHGLSQDDVRLWRKALRKGAPPPLPGSRKTSPLTEFVARAKEAETAAATFAETLPRELEVVRRGLLAAARAVLPRYLVFTDSAVRERLLRESSADVLPPRNKQARAHERHLLLYLQRVCAKNDSLSEFGPEGWGTVDQATPALTLRPRPGIARRAVFLERWTAQGAAAALNADPEVRSELAPRLNPNGRIEGNRFVFTDSGDTEELTPEALAILQRCNGEAAAHSLGVNVAILEQLAARKIIRWEVEVPAMEAHAFAVLLHDVARWRESAVRTRWLDQLQPIAELPGKFAEESDAAGRSKIMDDARRSLESLGAVRHGTERILYAATNPIGEECVRECGFSIDPRLINEVASEAAPWIDLWRDSYAFVAHRVAAGLRRLVEEAPRENGVLSLPAFLLHCRKMPLTGPGLVALAHLAFQELKMAFREKFQDRRDLAESELTADDCHFLRQNFEYERFDEYTYPSADLQLAAKSADAVGRGDYQWILAELHPPIALIHHGFFWGCPDPQALSDALLSTVFGRPCFHFGFAPADFTAATTVRLFDALPGLCHFVAAQRGNAQWPTVRPAEAEVYVDDKTGDVCLRRTGSNDFLGSFARAWLIPLGFHPFVFSLGEHTPRLRCGKIIVQRRTWSVKEEELAPGNFTGVSGDLVLAVERLRARKNLPRHIYIRPTEQALRRSGAEGRDKDTKPVYVDLESYPFLEIFSRWLTKAGEVEVTEMLPAPDDLLWREPDGRRTFELRTQMVPAS